MAIPAPQSSWRRFWKSGTPWECSAALAALAPATAAVVKFARDGNGQWAFWVGLAAGLAFIAAVGKSIVGYLKESKKTDIHEISGCLHTLNAVLKGNADDKIVRLRSTLYVPKPKSSTTLVQALPYVGNQRKKRKTPHEMSMNSGVVGKACREKTAFAGAREGGAAYDEFVQQMVTTYGFTDEQARGLDGSTESWMAAPIINEKTDEIEGVLYRDSTDREFFNETRQQAIAYAAVGIAFFVGLRYSSN